MVEEITEDLGVFEILLSKESLSSWLEFGPQLPVERDLSKNNYSLLDKCA